MKLVLFDVDGTLVTLRGAGRRALSRAMQLVYGTAGDMDGYDSRGKTDPRIVFDVMGAAGLPADRVKAGLGDCFEAYLRVLVEEITDGGGVIILPGIESVVRRLARTEGVMLGLLTGNVEEAARIKLEHVALWPYFRTGAFGSDDADRRRLASLAARRAEALVGSRFSPAEVLVVGDTPHDIDCARALGAIAVAVATGNYPREELAAEGPDLLFDDFSDVDGVLAKLLSPAPTES